MSRFRMVTCKLFLWSYHHIEFLANQAMLQGLSLDALDPCKENCNTQLWACLKPCGNPLGDCANNCLTKAFPACKEACPKSPTSFNRQKTLSLVDPSSCEHDSDIWGATCEKDCHASNQPDDLAECLSECKDEVVERKAECIDVSFLACHSI